MIVSAAMVMRVDTTFRILGYPGFAMILFLLAEPAPAIWRCRSSGTIGRFTTGDPPAAETPKPAAFPATATASPAAELSSAAGSAPHQTERHRHDMDAHPPPALVVVAVGAAERLLPRSAQLVGGVGRRSLGRRVFALDTGEFPPQYGLDHGLTVSDSEFSIRWPARPAWRSSRATRWRC